MGQPVDVRLVSQYLTKKEKISRPFVRFSIESNYNKFKDVILELCAGRYQPDRKLIFIITYINVNSNHLLDIVKALPDSISKRISNISFGKDVLSAGGCKENLDKS